MKITLLRHGKPKMPRFNKMTGYEFGTWINTYNNAPLDECSLPPPESMSVAKSHNAAICSTLIRSIESSTQLELAHTVEASEDFIEAGLPYYDIFNLKFSDKVWSVLFRVLWFLGYSPNSESYSQAKARAKNCSDKLELIANKNESVIFIGHGILNRLISKELRNRGWSGDTGIKSGHWQFATFEK